MHSDSSNLRVVRHNPARNRLIKIIFMALILVSASVSYWLGGNKAGDVNTILLDENHELVQQIKQEKAKSEELQQRVIILESSGKIDNEAISHIRLLVKKLEADKEQLNKELGFFKSIMAPEEMSPGVRVAGLDLVRGKVSRQYRLRLVVSQVSRSSYFLKGVITIYLIGNQGEAEKLLPLQQFLGLDQLPALGFRYFQAIPGDREFFDFELPDDFEPKAIKVAIRIKSGAAQNFEKIYQWEKELAKDVQ